MFDRSIDLVEHWQDHRLTHPVALLVITLFALPLFLVFLGTGDARAMMELFNLVPVREALRDGHWLIPTLNGAPRLEKPPLPVWLPAGLGALFGTDSLWVVRLPSVLMGLITCWATYGIGCVLSKDRKLGFWAALVLAANVIFIRQSRLASYDIFSTAFITVGFLGLVGLAEACPFHPSANPLHRAVRLRRRFAWPWILLSGIGFGVAVLSKGPVPVATVALPFALWLLIFHPKRWDAWLGIFAAAIVSVLVFMPWLLAAAARDPQAWSVWRGQFFQFTAAEGQEYRAVWYYYVGFFGFIFPWSVALIGALALPFLAKRHEPSLSKGQSDITAASHTSDRESRGRWLLWMVLVLGIVMLSIPHEKKQRYALQQVPFAALLIAALWQEFSRLPKTQPLSLGAKLLLKGHAILFMGTGLCVGLLIAVASMSPATLLHLFPHASPNFRTMLLQAPAQMQMAVSTFGIAGWVCIGLVIVALGVLASVAQDRRRFAGSFAIYLLAAWVIMLATYWTYRVAGDWQTNEYRGTAEAIDRMAGPNPIYSLPGTSLWLNTLYYANRTMPETQPQAIVEDARRWHGPIYVLARDNPEKPAEWLKSQATLEKIAQATGRKITPADPVDQFKDGLVGTQKLYRLTPNP